MSFAETEGDGIVRLTLNNSDTRNAISDLPMLEAWLGRCTIQRNPATRVIILTKALPAFSSGIKAVSAQEWGQAGLPDG